MGIQNLSEDILLATLHREPHSGDELEKLNDIAGDGCRCDVIVDFSSVEMLTSESICSLMILNQYLSAAGRELVLCNVPVGIQQIFSRTGLEEVFTFAEDEYSALQTVRRLTILYG